MSSYRFTLRPTWTIPALWHKSKFNFWTFLKKNQIFVFSCCSTSEDLSIDVSITNLELISTKPERFLFLKYGNSISSILNFKKIPLFGFQCCSTGEDLSIDASITNVGLISTKPGWFFPRGTDTDRQTRFWNPHMETCWHTKNFNSKLKISG